MYSFSQKGGSPGVRAELDGRIEWTVSGNGASPPQDAQSLTLDSLHGQVTPMNRGDQPPSKIYARQLAPMTHEEDADLARTASLPNAFMSWSAHTVQAADEKRRGDLQTFRESRVMNSECRAPPSNPEVV